MYSFQILDPKEILRVVPLIYELNKAEIPISELEERCKDMVGPNYQCAVIFENSEIVGVAGLWFCTRHYIGKSAEIDHVFISPEHRGNGLGKDFMKWIEDYLKSQKVKSFELNTYVNNYPSHKFYYNLDFEILGYHFLKKL